jgi:hypothetical protein
VFSGVVDVVGRVNDPKNDGRKVAPWRRGEAEVLRFEVDSWTVVPDDHFANEGIASNVSKDEFESFPTLPVQHDRGDADDRGGVAPESFVAEDGGGVGGAALVNHAGEVEEGGFLVGGGRGGDIRRRQFLLVVPCC